MIFVNPVKRSHSEGNISFYNSISGTYEAMLEKEPFNKIIRETVEAKFCKTVMPGVVLDFGGGTGLDLKWLSAHNHKIYFCEPAVKMRDKATAYADVYLKDKQIFFLDDSSTDFTTWQSGKPFFQKMDSILCNFAVINCIQNIKTLFKHFAEIMEPGGHLIALVLQYNFIKIVKSNPLHIIKRFVLPGPFSYKIKHGENEQIVFLHSIKEIQKASGLYFNFLESEQLIEYPYYLIHMTKK